jgi:hypothetical protein
MVVLQVSSRVLWSWSGTDLIAMIRDERKVMLLGKHKAGKPRIHIYTAAGALLSSLNVSLPSLKLELEV